MDVEYGVIYQIHCAGKYYIGATKNPHKRYLEHLRGNKQEVDRMMKTHPFTYDEIITAPLAELPALEKKYIEEYGSMYPNGYNRQSGGTEDYYVCSITRDLIGIKSADRIQKYGTPTQGKHLSAETKKKIGDQKRGRKASEETRHLLSMLRKGTKQSPEWIQKRVAKRSKIVRQYDTEGKIIAEYPSCAEASKQTGCSQQSISRACNYGSLAKGYVWKFAEVPE